MLESDCLLVWLKKTFIATILLLCLLIALSKVTEVCVCACVRACLSLCVCVCVGVLLTEKLYTMSKVKVKYHVNVKISYNKNIQSCAHVCIMI